MKTRLAPAYSFHSQGGVERWHCELWGLCRSLKIIVETICGVRVGPPHSLTPRIVKFAVWIYHRF
eukprot:11155408-Lingulodinium_polyedra.AAC.1